MILRIIQLNLITLFLGQQSEEFLEPNVRSGQLRQALGALSSALNGDSYNSVLANIGLNPNEGTFYHEKHVFTTNSTHQYYIMCISKL